MRPEADMARGEDFRKRPKEITDRPKRGTCTTESSQMGTWLLALWAVKPW